MSTFSGVLVFSLILVTVLSWMFKRRQREELFSKSIELQKNFNILLAEVEKRIEHLENLKKNETISASHVQCSELVTDLIKYEISNHAIANLTVSYKYDEARVYLSSDFEEKEYKIKGNKYDVVTLPKEFESSYAEPVNFLNS